ncbi:hypothetical protein GCM10011386_35000 [Parapedobacter defluvii]|uniref:Uncharacterized protein n=1 Tax=Parapedobacter defluvii TaxID=2045106 RepID=A0ABQ1MGP4_9SPHI|nr:hypothetical protein [Parapedobacter defluvii]GGC39920.1 hypothetical protein GCM10011386_35000 [Parapedobacter defluvii]
MGIYFNWREALRPLNLINRQMTLAHVFFIALTVFMMGLLCVMHTEDLITTRMGKTISLGLGIFWIIRLLIQFFGYSSELWRGKVFETTVHVVFSLLWIYFSAMFLLVAIAR